MFLNKIFNKVLMFEIALNRAAPPPPPPRKSPKGTGTTTKYIRHCAPPDGVLP